MSKSMCMFTYDCMQDAGPGPPTHVGSRGVEARDMNSRRLSTQCRENFGEGRGRQAGRCCPPAALYTSTSLYSGPQCD